MGYGYCERMQWSPAERWMIAPGTPPAVAPSTWPGSELPSRRAGGPGPLRKPMVSTTPRTLMT